MIAALNVMIILGYMQVLVLQYVPTHTIQMMIPVSVNNVNHHAKIVLEQVNMIVEVV